MIEDIIFDNAFFKAFMKWQKDFPCSKCNKPRLGFSTNENIKNPIICTNCHTQFTLQSFGRGITE